MTPGQEANFIQAEAASRLGLIQALGLIPHGARSAAFLLSTHGFHHQHEKTHALH